jgi:hypothetical protein
MNEHQRALQDMADGHVIDGRLFDPPFHAPDPALLEREGRRCWVTVQCQTWKLEGPALRDGARLIVEDVKAWQFVIERGVYEAQPGPIEVQKRAEEATGVLAWLAFVSSKKVSE